MTGNLEDGEREGATGPFLEIACDESGSDGENLTGGNTDVFAHASVSLSVAEAAAAVREIRDRIRSPAEEYKANHLLREKHRAVLEWLLAPDGPIHGQARVHLMEKTFFVVDRAVGLLLDDPAAAVALFRAGPPTFGEEGWRTFLEAANRLLRVRGDGEPVNAFYGTVDALRRAHPGTDAAGILERLAATRPRAVSYRAGFLDGPPLIPVLNPLLPAIVRTAALWSGDGRPVRLVHDRQNMLTPDRIAWLEEAARRAGVGLAGLRLVVAREDARVQVADFLAGIARKIASDELNGRSDPALTALLRPYVDPASVWGDARSRALLAAPVAG
ncbi:hypothetical protein [Streptomyces lomondensis]|uniref:DUF3800 domain-containing protein n=1 Tax=Streptomyces lomondensis TaxID=68229 RepID=A0ABQ2XIW8_9ACTN|nr:hypothetical protein [Streptomyces lomondensis]MCF0079684.1 hypothetical protein [Streptomyces lomondensis]GGX19796.1 hypothetical protein GCM10010383_57390 [Streptomyces lomondensis]